MFKKLLSCLLAVVMLFALAVPALAEDTEARSIEPTMTNIMERTATEWMAEDSSRVLLATCILIDIMLSDYEDLSDIVVSAVTSGHVYVALDGAELQAFFFGTEYTVMAIYDPAAQIMVADILGTSTVNYAGTMMDSLQAEGIFSLYYEIPGTNILFMYEAILEALQS